MYKVLTSDDIETSTGQDVYVMPVLRTAKGKSPKERLPCGIYILGT